MGMKESLGSVIGKLIATVFVAVAYGCNRDHCGCAYTPVRGAKWSFAPRAVGADWETLRGNEAGTCYYDAPIGERKTVYKSPSKCVVDIEQDEYAGTRPYRSLDAGVLQEEVTITFDYEKDEVLIMYSGDRESVHDLLHKNPPPHSRILAEQVLEMVGRKLAPNQ